MDCITAGSGKYRVTLEVSQTGGRGICVFAYGGQTPHIGGVATAVPWLKPGGGGLTCSVSQICLPEHKDAVAAADIADFLAKELDEPVAVTAGIHVDNATYEEVLLLKANAFEAARAWLQEYH